MKTRAKGSKRKGPVKGNIGRPVTPAQRDKVLLALASGVGTVAAAKAGGVHRETVRRWLSDPADDFTARLEAELAEIRARQRDRIAAAAGVAIDTLVAKTKRGNVQAAIALLKAVTPTKLEHTGADGGPIATTTHATMTVEQIEARTRELLGALEAAKGGA